MSKAQKDFIKDFTKENLENAQILDFEPREPGFYTQDEIDRIISNLKNLDEAF